MLCRQVPKVQRQLFCLQNILTIQSSSRKTFCEQPQSRKMSSNLGGDYVDAKVLEAPFKVEGEVVKGFGRGSRELQIPTGRYLPFVRTWQIICQSLVLNKHERNCNWNVTPLIGNFGGREGIYRFLWSPPSPWVLPSLFICRDFFSFCHLNRVHARLHAQGLARGLAMSACH